MFLGTKRPYLYILHCLFIHVHPLSTYRSSEHLLKFTHLLPIMKKNMNLCIIYLWAFPIHIKPLVFSLCAISNSNLPLFKKFCSC